MNLPPEYDIDEFKKRYPRLSDELFSGKTKQFKMKIDILDPWRGYVPTVVDYIRRCKTIEEAFEVVDYLLKRNELSLEEAEKIKEILKSNGLDAFGGRKEDDYYFKEARKFWNNMRARMRREIEPGDLDIEEHST